MSPSPADAERALRAGRFPAAAEAARRWLAAGGEQAQGRRLLGTALLLSGKPRAALASLDAALRLSPGDREARLWRGEANRALGRRASALADFEAAQDGEAFWLCARLNEILVRLNARDSRWESVWSALGRESVDPWTRKSVRRERKAARVRALILRRLADLGARRDFPRATERARLNSLCKEAQLELPVEGSRAVLRRLDALLRRLPEEPRLLVYRGEVKLWLGRWSAARRDFLAALKHNRREPGYVRWAPVGLAAACVGLGRPREALDWLARAGGGTPTFHIWRAEALLALGRAREARADFRSALRLSPERICARVGLALAEGSPAAQAALIERLRREAPGLAAAAASRGTPRRALAACLTMMRGCRSQMVPLYFTNTGRPRLISGREIERGV